jgi:hypothetical protein
LSEEIQVSSIRFSESIGNLTAALAAAQLKFEPIFKDKTNLHTNSKYADLRSIVAATQPALAAEGIAIIQIPVVRGRDAGCFTRMAHKSGEFIESELLLPTAMPGRADKFDAQVIGSAVTYAKKYTYGGFIGAVAEDDDDGNAAADSQKDVQPTQNKAVSKAKPEAVKAPGPVNSKPAAQGTRPETGQPVKTTTVPTLPAEPVIVATNAQESLQTQELPPDGLPTAQDLDAAAQEQEIAAATSTKSTPSEPPNPEQFENFKKRAADLRVVLEKSGLKPSAKPALSTGAKLVKYFTQSAGVQKVDELSVSQWNTIFQVLDTLLNTDPAKAVQLIEERIK